MPITQLDNGQLQSLLSEQAELQLLDVRTPEEYHQLGHIPGARLLPIHLLPDSLPLLNPDLPTVVVCEHGIRSADAAWFLVSKGFERVYNLTAGMAEWNGPREYAS